MPAASGLRRGRPRYRIGYVAECFQYIAAQQRRQWMRTGRVEPVHIALSIACRDLRMSKRMWLRMVRILVAAGWIGREAKTGGEHNKGSRYWLRDVLVEANLPSPTAPNGHGIRERSGGPSNSDPISSELWPPDPQGAQAFDPRIQSQQEETQLANVPYIRSERSRMGGESYSLNVPEGLLNVSNNRSYERSLGERSCPTGDSSAAPPPSDADPSVASPTQTGADPSPNPSPGRGDRPSTEAEGIPVRVWNGEAYDLPRSGPSPEIKAEVYALFRRRVNPNSP